MFCDSCGQQIRDDAQFCSACGKSQAGAAPQTAASPVRDGRVGRNLRTLSALWIVIGALRVAEAVWITFVGHLVFPVIGASWISDASPFSGRFPFENIAWSGIAFVGFMMGLFGAFEVVIGWGLLDRQPWARILGIIVGFLLLLRFPFGTAVGIYTLWVLLPAHSGREYDLLARAT
ncbi:MAG TPA: zinc ribbon domain-containing protein [Candidatus Acidoferrales bacterium]|nr:zinc ribbon domain-containing protein [Candidatus Acidoferrales bacterium]